MHDHNHHHQSVSNIKVAFWLNAGFTVVEIIGGLLTGSIAILSDALHDFGDSLSLGLALYLEKVSQKKPNQKFSYGYKRFSLLGSLITSIVLIVGSSIILWEASQRFLDPVRPVVEGMFFLALLGVAVNGYAALRVWRGSTLNERVISWHMLEDVLGWVAVLVVSVVMYFWDLPILDPLLSVVFASFILFGVFKNFRKIFDLFMQSTPDSFDADALRNSLQRTEGVTGVHDMHVWSLDGESHVLSVHLVVRREMNPIEVKSEARRLILSLGKIHPTIEIEFEGEDCPALDCISP